LAQSGLGLAADANHDNFVDSTDYGTWRRNYGLIAVDGSSPSVPEPTISALGAIVALLSIVTRGRRSRI
jgi:hypothetical protein